VPAVGHAVGRTCAVSVEIRHLRAARGSIRSGGACFLARISVDAGQPSRMEVLLASVPDTAGLDTADTAGATEAVMAALAQLPPRLRAVIVLRYYHDLSERDVAAALGVTVGTVKSHSSKATHSGSGQDGRPGWRSAEPGQGWPRLGAADMAAHVELLVFVDMATLLQTAAFNGVRTALTTWRRRCRLCGCLARRQAGRERPG
jgi:hypothetical protein